jgi:hypothetical protein
MTDLLPCPGCRRHIAITERTCPFCATALAPTTVRRPILARRAPRAAVFASVTLVACWTSKGADTHSNVVPDERANQGSAAPGDGSEHAASDEPHFARALIDAGVAAAPPDAAARHVIKKGCQPVGAFDPADNRPICGDEGNDINRGHRCVDQGPNKPPVCMPYGAPPARRRIV